MPRANRFLRFGPALLSGAAGAGMGAVFPPIDAPWILMPVAITSLLIATRDATVRVVVRRTFLFGLGFHLVLLRWMLAIGVDAWLALACLEALFLLPLAWVRPRLKGTGLLLIGPLWSASDWLRDNAGPVAFGWGQPAFGSLDAPWMRLAPWTTQWVLSALIVSIAAALALLCERGMAIRLVGGGLAILLIALPLTIDAPQPGAVSPTRIALVQAGVPHTGIGFSGNLLDVLKRKAELTRSAVAPGAAAAVIWPENSVDVDPYRDIRANNILESTSRSIRTPIVLGAVLSDGEFRRNATLIADGAELTTVYVKQRLVPFGEVMPARQLMERFFARAAFVPLDFAPGTGPGQMDIAGRRIGIVICFEIADEAIVRDAAMHADAVVLQTNNATYAGLGQGEQQLRIAQLRALQLGVPVYMVSTNGPSAIIDRDGRILQHLNDDSTGVLFASLP